MGAILLRRFTYCTTRRGWMSISSIGLQFGLDVSCKLAQKPPPNPVEVSTRYVQQPLPNWHFCAEVPPKYKCNTGGTGYR
eukprot:1696524-Pyramimonas_sp.AAC.1